jgi:hypothetical protein
MKPEIAPNKLKVSYEAIIIQPHPLITNAAMKAMAVNTNHHQVVGVPSLR